MSEIQSRVLPAYGGTGDAVAARRTRRAIRYGFAAFLFTCGALWIADGYLRYDQAERLFRGALALENPNSSRVYLRQVVRMDEKRGKQANIKYLQALAEREEEDLILPTYEKAYSLDKSSATVALRYGVRLFVERRLSEARDRFHDAFLAEPENALGAYLEAAAMLRSGDTRAETQESLALVAKTNNSERRVSFPKPVWTGTLPKDGKTYANLRRAVVEECLAPLYLYSDRLVALAKEDIEHGQGQSWNTWIEVLDQMGQRIIESGEQASLQTIAGIQIQLACLDLRKRIMESGAAAHNEEMIGRKVKLETALDLLNSFESERGVRIENEEEKFGVFIRLCGKGVLFVAVWFVLSFLLTTLAGVADTCWTIPFSNMAKISLVLGTFSLFLVLVLLTVTVSTAVYDSSWIVAGETTWWVIVFFTCGFGMVCPYFALVRPRNLLDKNEIAFPASVLTDASRDYVRAYILLWRRYAGIWLGLVMCVVVSWFIFYRVVMSVYPFYQTGLIVPGLANEEATVVMQALTSLR